MRTPAVHLALGILGAFCLLVRATSVSGQSSDGSYSETLTTIEKTYSSSKIILDCTALLRQSIKETLAAVPTNLRAELAAAIDSRLQSQLQRSAEYNAPEYRSAFLAQRLLDLRSDLTAIQHRPIADSTSEREAASNQYTDLLNYATGSLEQQRSSLERNLADMMANAFHGTIGKAQNDIFSHGYGELISDTQYSEIVAVIDAQIASAVAYSSELNDSSNSLQSMRGASLLVDKARDALSEILHRKSNDSLSSESAVNAMKAVVEESSSLQSQLNEQLLKSEQLEIAAIINNTKSKARATAAAQVAASQERNTNAANQASHTHLPAAQVPPVGQTSDWLSTQKILIATNIAVIALLLFFVYRQRR
jgi:hypothetical protein